MGFIIAYPTKITTLVPYNFNPTKFLRGRKKDHSSQTLHLIRPKKSIDAELDVLFMPGRFGKSVQRPGWEKNGRNQVAFFLNNLKNVESITKVGQKLSTYCKRFENYSSSSLPNSVFWLFAEICKNVTGKR